MMRINPLVFMIVASAALCSQQAFADDGFCFSQASSRYRVPETLLRAISKVESGGNPAAMHKNKDGTIDLGHMQVNTGWLPTLAQYGITKAQLMNPCTNTNVGAWILATNIYHMGYGWKAVGKYNANSPSKGAAYSQKVAIALRAETQNQGHKVD